jgi:hypothetical protein
MIVGRSKASVPVIEVVAPTSIERALRHAVIVVREWRLWRKFRELCMRYFPTLLDMADPAGCARKFAPDYLGPLMALADTIIFKD